MKVVSLLGSKGYLLSQRGPGGGVRLKLMPKQVGLADVIRDTEGNLNLLHKAESPIGHERLSVVFADAMDAFLSSLNQSSLADLIEPREELSRQLGIAR
jgi:Rrf2 family nitric oxide-sensitive transcriptional repressor